jgi:hypothetical protein
MLPRAETISITKKNQGRPRNGSGKEEQTRGEGSGPIILGRRRGLLGGERVSGGKVGGAAGGIAHDLPLYSRFYH